MRRATTTTLIPPDSPSLQRPHSANDVQILCSTSRRHTPRHSWSGSVSGSISENQWGKSGGSSTISPIGATAVEVSAWGKEQKDRKNFMQRKRIVGEIIDTERSYTASLQQLLQYYMLPLQTSPTKYGIKKKQVDIVFASIEPIATFHTIFLKDLENGTSLSHIINKNGDYLKMYTSYIADYNQRLKTVGDMKKSKKFLLFLEDIRSQHRMLDIGSFLIMPIQRIPRYQMLLGELKRNTDEHSEEYASIEQAYTKIQSIAVHVNESSRHIDNMTKLLIIQDRIQGGGFQLLQPHRRLIREGEIMQKIRGPIVQKKTRVVFLFSDIILWTTREGNYLFHIDLAEAVVEDNEKHPDISFQFLPTGSDNHPLVFVCKDSSEKQHWMQSINNALKELCESLVSRLDERQRDKLNDTASASSMIREVRLTLRKQKYTNRRRLHNEHQTQLQQLVDRDKSSGQTHKELNKS